MLTIAVCDDEEYYRKYIKKLLGNYLDRHKIEHQVDIFSSGEELCVKGQELSVYEVVFLDISMNRVNGIETAHRIKKYNPNAFLVFVTAFVNYAPEGYKVEAFRYILKEALKPSITECMDAILDKVRIRERKMVFSFKEGKAPIYVDKICYIESRSHSLVFHVADSGMETSLHTMCGKLDQMEHLLSRYDFLRIHKSFLVNLKYIRKINNYKALLLTNIELPVSRSRYQTAKEEYVAYKCEK